MANLHSWPGLDIKSIKPVSAECIDAIHPGKLLPHLHHQDSQGHICASGLALFHNTWFSLVMFVFHLQEQRNHLRDYQLERCLALSLLQNVFFSQPKHGEFVVRSCKETANSWQGCNCGKDCKNNPFLPLEKCIKYTLHLEILISADFHGQNHWLLPGLLLLCHLLHWSSHFFEAMLQPQLLPNSLISFWDLFGQSSQELTNFTPVHGIKLFMWTHRVGSNFLTEKDGISLWEEKIWLPELAGNIPVCHRAGEAVTNLSAPFDLHVTTPLLFHPLWNISLRFVLSGQRTGFLCNYVKVAVLPRPQ